MIVDITSHAELRMKDRGITEAQIRKVLRNPKEVISVRYGRLAAYGEIEERKLVVYMGGKMKILKWLPRCGWMKGG